MKVKLPALKRAKMAVTHLELARTDDTSRRHAPRHEHLIAARDQLRAALVALEEELR